MNIIRNTLREALDAIKTILYGPKLTIEILEKRGLLPFYADSYAAGLDLRSPDHYVIEPWDQLIVPLGIKMNIPKGYWLKIESRSGLSVKHKIETGAGVIDNNYRKEISVVLYNFGDRPYVIVKGDRIAQGVLHEQTQARVGSGKVPKNSREGFGSSGY